MSQFADQAPVVRTSQLAVNGQSYSLYELSVPKPEPKAVAVVLDLSDSCPRLHTLFERLPQLLSVLPRSWPVWVYSLSQFHQLDHGDLCVGDVQDQAAAATGLLVEGAARRDGQTRGSVFRAPYDAILKRRAAQNVREILVLVLTDGQLLDASPIEVDAATVIIGVASDGLQRGLRHWARVLPTSPWVDLQDYRLTDLLQKITNPFYGRCRVSWANSRGIHAVDLQGRRLREVESPIEHNFSSGSLLLADCANSGKDAVGFLCKPASEAPVIPKADDSPPARDALLALEEILGQTGKPLGEILLDASSTDTGFASAYCSFVTARELAKQFRPWRNTGGTFPFADSVELKSRQVDALLCIATGSPDPEHLLVIALHRSAKPALRWPVGHELKKAKLEKGVAIYYDRMEARWMFLCEGSMPAELDPRGSQYLALPLTSPKACEVVFSGDLT